VFRSYPSAARKLAVTAVTAVAATALAAPAPASAATNCDASALRGTLLTATLPGVTANGGAGACASTTAGLDAALPLGITAGVLSARTRSDASGAHATAEVADVRVGGLTALTDLLAPNLGSGLLDIPLLGEVNLLPALQDLLAPVDTLELLHVGAVEANADVTCVGNTPQFTGSSSIASLQLAGRDLPVNEPLTDTVALVDTQSIDPSDIDLAKVILPLGLDLTPVVRGLLQPALDALPTISVPAALAHVQLKPAQHIVEGGRHTWRALEAKIDVAGQSVTNLVLAEASVSAAAADCAGGPPTDPPTDPPTNPPTNPPGGRNGDGNRGGAGGSTQGAANVANAALACTDRRIVLTDVSTRNGRVAFEGVAHRQFVGKKVKIRMPASGAVVARPVVGRAGRFVATAKLPARSIRSTNAARYRAYVGKDRSNVLKLARRMTISSTDVSGGRVTIAGRVIRPYTKSRQAIVISRRVSCSSWKRVAKVQPTASGRFRARVAAPASGKVGVYRIQTRVTWRSDPSRLTRTYTLPSYVQG
jgi:hypothetical protein